MGKTILRFKMFACKYQEEIFQVLENGDELYGVCKPIISYLVSWSYSIFYLDTIALLFITIYILLVIRNRKF